MTSWLEQSSAIWLAAVLTFIAGVALQADPDQGGGAGQGAAPGSGARHCEARSWSGEGT